jgi:hypothetical protein
MSKLYCTIISLLLAVSLLACSNETKESEQSSAEKQVNQVQHSPASEVATSGEEGSIIGTWAFRFGDKEMRVTYYPDGSYESESILGGAVFQLHGTYDFDGKTLTARPVRVTTSDSTDTEALENVRKANEHIQEDPDALVEVSTITWQGKDTFTAFLEKGGQLRYVRQQ